MRITLQHPLGDVRPFVIGETGRLDRPRWLNPVYDSDFVRSVGVVRERPRGGVRPWPAEQTFCSAARLLRFPAPLAAWAGPHASHPAVRSLQFSARRLFDNGEAVSRVEVTLANPPRRPPLAADSAFDLVLRATQLPVQVRGTGSPQPLKDAGAAIAPALLEATTCVHTAPEPDWLAIGRPVVLVEHARREVGAPLIADARRPALDLPGISAHLLRLDGLSLWLVATGADVAADQVRQLRIHLLRLHAEREALGIVLDALAGGRLAGREDDPVAFSRLERYLQRAAGFLRREKVYGHSQPELLEIAYGADDLVSPGRRETLLEYLEQASLATRTAVREVAKLPFG